MAMDWHKRDIVVAREEAYVCGVEGRGSCYAFEVCTCLLTVPLALWSDVFYYGN